MADISIKSILPLFKSTVAQFNENNSFRLAGALAFNAIFSIPPLLIILIRVAGAFFGEKAVSGELAGQISKAVGPEAAEQVETIIKNTEVSGAGGMALWIGIGTLIFASTTFFATLQESLNSVWNLKVKPKSGILQMIKVRLSSFGIVLSIALLLLMSLIISAAVAVLSDFLTSIIPDIGIFFIILVNFLLSLAIVTVLFALIYKFLPDATIRWKDVWIGAIVTALLFGLGKFLIGWYIGTSDPGSAYGAAGAVILILIWIYYSSLIVFFGAEFTQQYACQLGQDIRPKPHAVFVRQEEVNEHPRDKSSGRPRAQGRFNKNP